MRGVCVLSLFAVTYSALTHSDSYQWVDPESGRAVLCDKCPPGSHVVRHCTRHSGTVCGACPELHFTQYWNYVERCLYCNVMCGPEQYEKSPCTATHNRVCECRSGYYLNHGYCDTHTHCPPGEGVIRPGTAVADVQCAPCNDGFFSPAPSNTEACVKHSQCAANERAIPGDKKHDTFCTACISTNVSTVTTDHERAICDDAIMNYVAQHTLSAKKQKRLERVARAMAGNKMPHATLLELFATIQEQYRMQPFIKVMVQLLHRARLDDLNWKLRRGFLDEDTVYYPYNFYNY